MKRSSFLKLGTVLGSAFYAPFSLFAGARRYWREKKGFKVDAGKDRFNKSIDIFDGDTFYTKVSGKDTDGDLFVFESTRSKEGGPILHTHYNQDEWWHILEGTFIVRVGEHTYDAKPGDVIFGPRGVPHTFSKVGPGLARVIIGFQPAGMMEEMFAKISAGATKNMTDAERDQFRKDHGFERVGPPIKQLKQ